MIKFQNIKSDMPVVCSLNSQFAVVDHMENQDSINLKKDKTGKHHFRRQGMPRSVVIPVSWVTLIDEKVHIDRPGPQAMQQWRTEN